jgi:hypothetical protein
LFVQSGRLTDNSHRDKLSVSLDFRRRWLGTFHEFGQHLNFTGRRAGW